MSSVILLKDRQIQQDGKSVTQKAGDLVSVPWGVGKDLVANGIAKYKQEPAKPVAPTNSEESEIQRLRKQNKDLQDQNKELQEQLEEALTATPPAKDGKK